MGKLARQINGYSDYFSGIVASVHIAKEQSFSDFKEQVLSDLEEIKSKKDKPPFSNDKNMQKYLGEYIEIISKMIKYGEIDYSNNLSKGEHLKMKNTLRQLAKARELAILIETYIKKASNGRHNWILE